MYLAKQNQGWDAYLRSVILILSNSKKRIINNTVNFSKLNQNVLLSKEECGKSLCQMAAWKSPHQNVLYLEIFKTSYLEVILLGFLAWSYISFIFSPEISIFF